MIKKLLIVSLVLLVGAATAATQQRLSNGYTQSASALFRAGFWWNPAQPGWGLDLHMANGRLVAGWATYERSGAPTWYLGVGEKNNLGQWQIPLLRYRWNQGQVTWVEAGSLTVDFTDGYRGTMQWQLDHGSGTEPIEAFVVDDLPIAEDLTGFWYRTDEPGYGQSIATQGDKLYGVVYLYDSAGQPSWVWVDNLAEGGGELAALRLTGTCPGCPSVAATQEPAGSAALGFLSENEGVWSLDVSTGAADQTREWQVSNALVRQLTDRASGREERYQLQPFTNADMLREYLIAGLTGGYNYPSIFDSSGPTFSPVAQELSQTNLQETGVDEADLIKSDGQYIFAAKGPDFGTAPATPSAVRVLQIDPQQPTLRALSELPIGRDNEVIDGLYLVTDASGAANLLVAVMNEPQYYYYDLWFAPYPWVEQITRLVFLDVSDPAAIEPLTEVELDGGIIATRRIDDQLYLVTRDAAAVPEAFAGLSQAELRAKLELADLLPRWRRDRVDQGLLVDADRVLLPPQPPYGRYAELVTVSAFDLADLSAPPQTASYAGLAETVYVSLNNLFIASSRYGYGYDPARSGSLSLFPNDVETDIHQFALTAAGPVYRGSGAAAGQMSWGAVSPAFQFSEHGEHLRLISSLYDWLGEFQQLSVLTLASEADKNLRVSGFIPNEQRPELIGKPNENLHGVRFFGDRLYAVTFKKTDPFYVIDLSDPRDPFIAGELELPGFSDYLHPVSESLVLGFGKNAVPAVGFGDRDFAWFQGLQLSLFDVADPSRPSLIERVDIGRRGSDSALLYDHHALAYLPASETRPARVSIPFDVADVGAGQAVDEDPTFVYPWRYTGLGMFEIDGVVSGEPDLIWRDTLISHRAEAGDNRPQVSDSGRGLIGTEHAYFYLNGSFYGGRWGQPDVDGPF